MVSASGAKRLYAEAICHRKLSFRRLNGYRPLVRVELDMVVLIEKLEVEIFHGFEILKLLVKVSHLLFEVIFS